MAGRGREERREGKERRERGERVGGIPSFSSLRCSYSPWQHARVTRGMAILPIVKSNKLNTRNKIK